MYKYKCELCHHSDEYLTCSKCVESYLNKSFAFKQSILKEKNALQQNLQDLLLNKFYTKLTSYNNKRLKQVIMLQKMKRNENFKIKITDKIYKIEFMESLINEKKSCLNNKLSSQNFESIKKEISSSDNLKKSYITVAANLIFNYNTLDINNYLEIQTYVKPNISQTEIEINFENIPNILSNEKDTKLDDIYILYDKFINIKSDVMSNQYIMNKFNSFIYKIIFFQESFSRLYDASLPYELRSFTILNKLSEKTYPLFYSKTMKDNNLHDLIQGYIYLDKNLIYINRYFQLRENRRRKSNFELNGFLDINQYINEESHELVKQESDSNELVFIDNYFI